MTIEQAKWEAEKINKSLAEVKDALGYDALKVRAEELRKEQAKDDFWNDMDNAQTINKELSRIESKIKHYDKLYSQGEDLEEKPSNGDGNMTENQDAEKEPESEESAEQGDIIYCEPVNWNQPDADCHIGFFWGRTSSENRFWHTSTSPKNGNQISGIVPGIYPSYFHLVKMK